MKKLFATVLTLFLALLISQTSYAAYGKKKTPPPAESAAAPTAPVAPAKPAVAAEASAQPIAAAQTVMPGMDEAMMTKLKEYSTPNENHKVLDYFSDNWDYSIKFWMKAEGPAEESTGASESKWLLDGRFLQQSVHGISMGQPFEGLAIIGYDNAKKEYRSVWLDNMATGILTSTLTYDPAAKTFHEVGSHSCPLETSGEKAFRAVITVVDDDHYNYKWFTTPPNEPTASEFKAMEINYTRKK